VLDASNRAIIPSCTWPAEDADDCSEEFQGPMLPTRQIGLTNTLTLFDNLKLYTFADYQGGHYQWCAICSVRTRIDLNTAAINDPRLVSTHPEWESYGKYERARLTSLQTKEFIYPADFIKLREVSLTYMLPPAFTERVGFSRASVTVSGRNLGLWTRYKGNSDPEVTFTSTSEFDASDYAAIPQLRRLLVSMNFNF
jgi:hypothetical protein